MTEARTMRARLLPLRTPEDDVEMRDAEATALEAEHTTGKAGATSPDAREEDKSSSEGSSSGVGDQSDADASRMSDEQSDSQGASRSRFKAAQALSILTSDLPGGSAEEQAATMTSAVVTTTSASQSTAAMPAAASGKPEAKAETAAGVASAPPPPAPSSGKKRRRRTAAQIDRKYSCNYPGCTKAYGSEGSLTQHQRLKHRQTPEESLASSRKGQQLGKLFLPLHRSPSGHLKAGAFLPPSSASTTRTVSIRPATMGGMPGSPFNVASPGPADVSVRLLAPDLLGDSGAAASALRSNLLAVNQEAAHAQHRSNNLRSRSNSMPISFAISSPVQTQHAPATSSRAQTARKSRASSTPRPKSTTARRAKSRSKSESLSGLANLAALDGMQLPRSDRSISDSTASTHEPVLPLESAEAQPLRSSWSVTDVTMSMDDQAIDSDILSVLANCDPGELGDGPAPLVAQNETVPASTSTFHSQTFSPMEDQDMLPVGLECFKIAEDVPAVDAAGSLKRESYRDGLSLQHDVGNVDPVGGGVGGGSSLFSAPDDLPADAKVAMEAVDVALASSSVAAFNPPADNFDMPTFDAPAENDSHTLSQINSFSSSVTNELVEGLNAIRAFGMDTTDDAELHDPGTPLQGIPTKLGKLNIENNACWRDVASLLSEPDSEEQLPQDPQQPQQLAQPQEQLMWTKDGVFGSAFSTGGGNRAQNPALATSSAEMDWESTSKLATSSSNIYLQASALHSESAIPGLFSDFLMSDAGDFGMLDTRIQAQVLGQDDDFL